MKFSAGHKTYPCIGDAKINVFEWHLKIRKLLVGVKAWESPTDMPEEWTPHVVKMLAEVGIEADDAVAYEFALSVLEDYQAVKKNITERVISRSGAERIPSDLPADCPTGSA